MWNDSKKLGQKLCTMVLDTHKLLASIYEQDWLVSNRAVAELEGKLPRDEKFEWAKICGSVAGEITPKLLSYTPRINVNFPICHSYTVNHLYMPES